MNIKTIIPAIVLPLLLGVSTTGCNEDTLDTYEGENGIYFDTTYNGAEMMSDTIKVHWGLENSNVTSQKVTLKVKLFGNTAPVDRKFSITVETDEGDDLAAAEGVDYVMPVTEYVLPAGKAEVPIEFEVLRRPNLKDSPRRVRINLVENEELKLLYTRGLPYIDENEETQVRPADFQRVILMEETFPIPVWWVIYGELYFGDWSATKAALICDVMNINRKEWVEVNVLTEGYLKYCGKYMHRYLQEQDPKILDEDGEPMVMGPVSIN